MNTVVGLTGPLNDEAAVNSTCAQIAQHFARRFDIAISARAATDHYHAAAFIQATGAPVRVTFEAGTSQPEIYTHLIRVPAEVRHQAEVNLLPLRPLGHEPTSSRLEIWPDSETSRQILERMRATVPDFGTGLCLVSIGAFRRRKLWPASRLGPFLSAVHERWGYVPVIVGSAGERAESELLCGHLHAPFANLTGETGIRELMALAAMCAIYVGGDSGPKHIAAAAGVPVFEISWVPENWPKTAPYGHATPAHFGAYGVPTMIVQPPPRPTHDRLDGTEISQITVERALAAFSEFATALEQGAMAGEYFSPTRPPAEKFPRGFFARRTRRCRRGHGSRPS